MSSDIPGLPPPPPPPYGAPVQESLPWERRAELGFVNAFVETIKLFVTSPAAAWSRTKAIGDYAEPLIFAILVSWIGIAVSSVWSGLFGQAWMSILPPEIKEKLGGAFAANAGAILIQVGLAPVFVLIGVFVGAAIYHVSFLVVGVTKDSTAGFEGTFRVVAYSTVSSLANVIPFVGWLVALVWSPILMVMGAVRIHRTTQGKAIVGIILPGLICCTCIAIAVALAIGGLAAVFKGN